MSRDRIVSSSATDIRAASAAAENPYASPQQPAAPMLGGCPGEPVTAELVEGSAMRRVFHLSGGVQGRLEWNAQWPVEFIRVQDCKVVAQHAIWYVPHFRFELPTEYGRLPAEVHVRMSRGLPIFLRSFRLIIDGQQVYAEGKKEHARGIWGRRNKPR